MRHAGSKNSEPARGQPVSKAIDEGLLWSNDSQIYFFRRREITDRIEICCIDRACSDRRKIPGLLDVVSIRVT
jgi:hypothetical protein